MTSNSTRVYAGTHAIHLQSQVHSAHELRRQNSRATLTSRWRRFLPFACWPPVCWSSPISSQAARTPHRMDQPRNTRNTRNPETGLFAFRVFRVFRGYHLGCGFAALARLVLATPDEDFGFPSDFGLRTSDLPSCRYRGKHTHPPTVHQGSKVIWQFGWFHMSKLPARAEACATRSPVVLPDIKL